mmetsp:Transcript_32329/g.49496  ORF Transcript_32329/g.49496 Transcript_32329/m.49496 type:complete len:106 (-) Transcript_32329:23-340(-)
MAQYDVWTVENHDHSSLNDYVNDEPEKYRVPAMKLPESASGLAKPSGIIKSGFLQTGYDVWTEENHDHSSHKDYVADEPKVYHVDPIELPEPGSELQKPSGVVGK